MPLAEAPRPRRKTAEQRQRRRVLERLARVGAPADYLDDSDLPDPRGLGSREVWAETRPGLVVGPGDQSGSAPGGTGLGADGVRVKAGDGEARRLRLKPSDRFFLGG